MATHKKQSGFSTIGWLVVICIVVAFSTVAIAIVPAYVENIYVQEGLKFLVKNNTDLPNVSASTLKGQLGKYMAINALGDVQSKSFKMKRYDGRLIVNSIYEVRENIVHDIDVVISFKNQLDTKNPDACCEYLIEIWDEDKK